MGRGKNLHSTIFIFTKNVQGKNMPWNRDYIHGPIHPYETKVQRCNRAFVFIHKNGK